MKRMSFTVPTCAPLLTMVILALSQSSHAQTIIYVDAAGNSGDGTSWATAMSDLQVALSVGRSGDQIWVKVGTYSPTTEFGDRTVSFILKNGVELYGGFAGHESTLTERDIEANTTILSGDLNGDDGGAGDTSENSYHVLTALGLEQTILDGFEVSGGNAEGPLVNVDGFFGTGGGLFCPGGNILIRNCRFIDNRSQTHGGAIWSSGALRIENSSFLQNQSNRGGAIRHRRAVDETTQPHMEIVNCEFIGNLTTTSGGAIHQFDASIMLDSCVFNANTTGGPGGAMILEYLKQADLTNCRFEMNRGYSGGGVFIISRQVAGSVTMIGCDFVENEGTFLGGGLIIAESNTLLINCSFKGNTTSTWGGGAFITSAGSDSINLYNCFFSGNKANSTGGGLYLSGGLFGTQLATIANCTFNRNCGSGLVTVDASAKLQNSIFWDNAPAQIVQETDTGPPQDMFGGSNILEAHYCNIQGGWTGPGSFNIDADPLFVQPISGDLRLGFDSPCLDTGNNSFIPANITTDFDGNLRIQGGTVDMGAFEGAFKQLPPSTDIDGIDAGALMILSLNPCSIVDFTSQAIILFQNTSTANEASVSMTELSDTAESNAGGFSELGVIVGFQTSLDDGQFNNLVVIPFDQAELQGRDPLDIDLTFFDSTTGVWELAAEDNTEPSPGHPTPLGDRTAVTGELFAPGQELGDYGVFYNPAIEAGVVWARLDHQGMFGLGFAFCDGDIAPAGAIDGQVNPEDLIHLLIHWGPAEGPEDLFPHEGDGVVNVSDLLHLLGTWGACP